MPRFTMVVVVCTLVVGLVAIGGVVGRGSVTGMAARQAASPEVEPDRARPVASPGIERIGCGSVSLGGGDPIPDAALVLEFNEVRFAPGEAIEQDLYPQPVIAYVLSGAVELNLIEIHDGGAARLRTREMQYNDQHPWQCATAEDLNPGRLVTLEAGDAIYLENARYRIRNPYSRDALLLTAVVTGDLYDACLGGCPRWP